MCLILDTCTFSAIFDRSNSEHAEFSPVTEWIRNGKGKLVYGGSRYRNELRRARRYHSLFLQLKKAQKVIEIEDHKVDPIERKVQKLVNKPDFNDAHIVGIVVASGCTIVCTNDLRAIPFLRRKDLYPRGVSRPKIYTRAQNKVLLCDSNIADICKPALQLSKRLKDLFSWDVNVGLRTVL